MAGNAYTQNTDQWKSYSTNNRTRVENENGGHILRPVLFLFSFLFFSLFLYGPCESRPQLISSPSFYDCIFLFLLRADNTLSYTFQRTLFLSLVFAEIVSGMNLCSPCPRYRKQQKQKKIIVPARVIYHVLRRGHTLWL